MPRMLGLRKVMVIGSGPITIGQAAEFDYAGTQACRALKEEGIKVVLVNSNPATIMTDVELSHAVYIEPLVADVVAEIIRKERPDGLLATLGGQTGLNLACELSDAGVLSRYGVELLGTPPEAIRSAEDRRLFKETMIRLGQPVPGSGIATSVGEALDLAGEIGFPVVVRPAFTLGGTGGGIAYNEDDLKAIVSTGLRQSRIGQVLIEKCLAGWKEIEYEVMRDARDTCITVCNMENVDPVGIHTGDSIVVAPSQTLSDKEYHLLRNAALSIIRGLGIEGGCNIQFALDPYSMNYYVIEVNPRVSRSSALASKATGYPIAKVAAKIAIGLSLDEIANSVTGKTTASFEPALDYVTVKIPRWPFDKFGKADRALGTQMKATGEVMAIGRTFEEAFMKALRSLDMGAGSSYFSVSRRWSLEEVMNKLERPNDLRIFAVGEALRRGVPQHEVARKSGFAPFFVEKIAKIISLEREIARSTQIEPDLMLRAKKAGFSDDSIGELAGKDPREVRAVRKASGIVPGYKTVDTCAAEFEASTPYYYSTYGGVDEVDASQRDKVVVLGSGPIRIGQGIEFDYCSVHCVWGLKEAGIESIIINNNPETVSTDFDVADRLYFEPLTTEDILNVVDKERPLGVMVQFGGQTAINQAGPLSSHGVKILGTPVEAIDMAEDREKFAALLDSLAIPAARWKAVESEHDAFAAAYEIGYPVVVRPSYVLGGRAMEIVRGPHELERYMSEAVRVAPGHPVLIDRYLEGKEVEVDAVSDGREVLIPGVMEHVERAGIHSGDSIAAFPSQTLTPEQVQTIVEYTTRIALALNIVGLINIQFVACGDEIYVLEANPRASRTVPIISKATGIPMVKVATRASLGVTLRDQGYRGGLMEPPPFVVVKAPVFSFEKLSMVDTCLGPEMKSTGEVLGVDRTFGRALAKAFMAAGCSVPPSGPVLLSLADRDKAQACALVSGLMETGFEIMATEHTAEFLRGSGLPPGSLKAVRFEDVDELLKGGEVGLVINTPTRGGVHTTRGFHLRRKAAEYKVPCFTSLDTAFAFVVGVKSLLEAGGVSPCPLNDYNCQVAPAGKDGITANGAATGKGRCS
ncbi:MAG TPA: carbamoyl-phosphate synthase large subunit [Firmicutes bacterium]|nr:carbamoyl-phosphate synthase large subunit [Bacillota bacterium]